MRFRRPGRRALLIAAAVLVLLSGFAAWALYGSDWLRVRHVSVSGTQELTDRQVRSAAHVPVGDPTASVDGVAAGRRVRAALSRVAEVRVVRSWPDGIVVHVTERRPQVVQKKAGGFVEVDAHGVRFATTDTRPHDVPLLLMSSQESADARHFGPDRLRREAVRVVSSLPDSVSRDTRNVRVRSYDSITLELTGGRTVLWGSGERSAAKAKSLTALMKAAKDARHFNVSVPSAPAWSRS